MSTTETMQRSEELVIGTPAGESKSWNWHPDIPIKTSPLFEFPPKPMASLKWVASTWLPITEFGLYVLLGIGVWFWLQPPLDETTNLAFEWVGAIWARNIIMMKVFATLLHLWLYTWRKQGDDMRYMRNAPTAEGKKFFGGRQLVDNVFWTPGLVRAVVSFNRHLAIVSLLLRASIVALQTPVRPLSRTTSPQYHRRPLVGVFHAPGRTSALSDGTTYLPARAVASIAHAVPCLLADARNRYFAFWISGTGRR